MNLFKETQLFCTGMTKENGTYIFSNNKMLKKHWATVVKRNSKATEEKPVKARITGNFTYFHSDFESLRNMNFQIPTELTFDNSSVVSLGGAKKLEKLTVTNARDVLVWESDVKTVSAECSNLNISDCNQLQTVNTTASKINALGCNFDNIKSFTAPADTEFDIFENDEQKLASIQHSVAPKP